jgi:hypothetical protein
MSHRRHMRDALLGFILDFRDHGVFLRWEFRKEPRALGNGLKDSDALSVLNRYVHIAEEVAFALSKSHVRIVATTYRT